MLHPKTKIIREQRHIIPPLRPQKLPAACVSTIKQGMNPLPEIFKRLIGGIKQGGAIRDAIGFP